jgi:hypothetical protein
MTTEAPEAPEAVNVHQPIAEGHRLVCGAPDCGYAIHTYPIRSLDDADRIATYWASLFKNNHSSQYDPGHAPDIAVEWEISATCSVCPDGGEIQMCEDGDAVCCDECGTHWDMNGNHGTRDEL